MRRVGWAGPGLGARRQEHFTVRSWEGPFTSPWGVSVSPTENEVGGMTPEFWLEWKLLCGDEGRGWLASRSLLCLHQDVGQAWARRPDMKEAQLCPM